MCSGAPRRVPGTVTGTQGCAPLRHAGPASRCVGGRGMADDAAAYQEVVEKEAADKERALLLCQERIQTLGAQFETADTLADGASARLYSHLAHIPPQGHPLSEFVCEYMDKGELEDAVAPHSAPKDVLVQAKDTVLSLFRRPAASPSMMTTRAASAGTGGTHGSALGDLVEEERNMYWQPVDKADKDDLQAHLCVQLSCLLRGVLKAHMFAEFEYIKASHIVHAHGGGAIDDFGVRPGPARAKNPVGDGELHAQATTTSSTGAGAPEGGVPRPELSAFIGALEEPQTPEQTRQVNMRAHAKAVNGFTLTCRPSVALGAVAGKERKYAEQYGAFIEGKAVAGTVLGYYPGTVYLQRHLKAIPDTLDFILPDDDLMCFARHDGVIVDSRTAVPSPIGVQERAARAQTHWDLFDRRQEAIPEESLYGWGHMCNHPLPGTTPNVMPIMFNVPTEVSLRESAIACLCPSWRCLPSTLPPPWGLHTVVTCLVCVLACFLWKSCGGVQLSGGCYLAKNMLKYIPNRYFEAPAFTRLTMDPLVHNRMVCGRCALAHCAAPHPVSVYGAGKTNHRSMCRVLMFVPACRCCCWPSVTWRMRSSLWTTV